MALVLSHPCMRSAAFRLGTVWGVVDEAIDQSCNSATRLIKNLMFCFFTPSVLANSSCFGTGRYPKLKRKYCRSSKHPGVGKPLGECCK